MKLYPLLETLARLESKDAMLGLVRAHQRQARGELAGQLKIAAELLKESASIDAFLVIAKRRNL